MRLVFHLAGLSMTAFAGWRMRRTGLEHLPDGGYVLAANHVSSMDPFVVALPLYPRRQVHWMAKAELFNRVLARPLRALGTFPVRRDEVDAGALRTSLELLRGGAVIGMFPEGTRATKGLRKKFAPKPHPGTARIALNAGVPLVPAAVVGTERLLRFGRFTVAYGPPIPVDDLAGLPRRRAAEIATERLMEAIASLVAQVERPGSEAGQSVPDAARAAGGSSANE